MFFCQYFMERGPASGWWQRHHLDVFKCFLLFCFWMFLSRFNEDKTCIWLMAKTPHHWKPAPSIVPQIWRKKLRSARRHCFLLLIYNIYIIPLLLYFSVSYRWQSVTYCVPFPRIKSHVEELNPVVLKCFSWFRTVKRNVGMYSNSRETCWHDFELSSRHFSWSVYDECSDSST